MMNFTVSGWMYEIVRERRTKEDNDRGRPDGGTFTLAHPLPRRIMMNFTLSGWMYEMVRERRTMDFHCASVRETSTDYRSKSKAAISTPS